MRRQICVSFVEIDTNCRMRTEMIWIKRRGLAAISALLLGAIVSTNAAATEKPVGPDGADSDSSVAAPTSAIGLEPNLRNEKMPGKFQRGNILAVPVPVSNPTLGTGLIATAGYYWNQTEEQAKVQPPSLTGIGAMYTDSESWALGLGQSAYWDENNWRLRAAVGYADLTLPLLVTDLLSIPVEIDWSLKGGLAFAQISRRVAGQWYVGLRGRYVNIDQDFSIDIGSNNFDLFPAIEAVSLGPSVEFDSRDTLNAPQQGRFFKFSSVATRSIGSSDISYEAYDIELRSYHKLANPLVLAWRLQACTRDDGAELWDACQIGLRGFATTDYMGQSSMLGEVEARWQFSKRWGAVAFAGTGTVDEAFRVSGDDDVLSYGIGVRWMVSPKNRVNVRLDYGRSRDSDALHLFVGEAF